MTASQDKILFIGCCKGDRAAQEALVRQFSNLVYSIILKTFKARAYECTSQDLEDLHNTVFMRLLERRCRRLRQFKGKNGCSLASWIRVITVRTVINHLRQRRDALSRPSRLDSGDMLIHLHADIPEPWQVLDRMEKNEMIHKAMKSLPPRDRLFLKLHCFEDLSIREVAGMLQISENNAYSLKYRAIKRLKAIIDRTWPINRSPCKDLSPPASV